MQTDHFQMFMSPEIDKLVTAMVEFQKENTRICFTATGYHKNKYADFDTIMDEIRPKLAKHGMIASFPSFPGYKIEHYRDEKNKEITQIFVDFGCQISHISGQWMGSAGTLPLNKDNNAQGYGASKTYSKRFLITGLLGITCGEPDDDGAFASNLTQTPPEATPLNSAPDISQPHASKPVSKETSVTATAPATKPKEEKPEEKRTVSQTSKMTDAQLDAASKEVDELMKNLP
jgi:ERF superfamily.